MKLGETMEALRRLAIRDQLTGLLNRREFDRILNEETERALRFGRSFALVMLDIDHFKSINDEHGHPAGDEVLRQVAAVLEGELRSVDRVARFGGEEFAIILMEVDKAAALETARRLCAAMARDPRTISNGLDLQVTLSAGAAAVPQDAKTPAELVAASDRALYAAKKGGRNRAVAAGG
jgi:diguanylate cyclase (GGDEF)-like protein